MWPVCVCPFDLCSVCAGRPAPQWGTRGHLAARNQPGDGRESTPGGGGGTGCEESDGLSRTTEDMWVSTTSLISFIWKHTNKMNEKRYLLEELRHLTHQAGIALHLAFVPVRQEEVTQQRSVRQCLDDAVHEACVAQVYQTAEAWEWSGGEKMW